MDDQVAGLMISSANIAPVFKIEVQSYEFEVATGYGERIDWVSTTDRRFRTPEGIGVGSSMKEVSRRVDAEVLGIPGWACFVELPSGWKAAFGFTLEEALEDGVWRPCKKQISPASEIAFLYMR